MARKTYHHIAEGDSVAIQRTEWDGDMNVRVLETVEGKVLKVLKTQVAIQFDFRLPKGNTFESVQNFSRQGGQMWGAHEDISYRIDPSLARPKER